MELTQKMREAIALKKFSIIAPVLNGQVESQRLYFESVCSNPIDIPHYGSKNYSVKTLQYWLSSYLKDGMEALIPGYRSDKGKHRKIDSCIAQIITKKKSAFPNITTKLIYEQLISEGILDESKVSIPTFYRFMQDVQILSQSSIQINEKDTRRFAHEFINELWQTDCMYGPYIKVGKAKKQTYLLAYIDDASRLCTHAQFYFTQSFDALRASFKEAILKRGVPKMLYTDNGKIYRSQQFEYICASLGTALIHAQPFTPQSKGKVERFFNTVRSRFLSALNPTELKDINELNLRFWKWLENDYQRKEHSSLGKSPLEVFMSQVSTINIFANPAALDEHFLIRVSRKVSKDATIQLGNTLYETDQRLADLRLEVRYDPEWLNINSPVHLYLDGKKVGIASKVNFHDNAHAKRRYPGNRKKNPDEADTLTESASCTEIDKDNLSTQAISYASFINKEEVK